MIRARLLFAPTVLALMSATGVANATSVTLHFDPSELGEATPQPVDGQSVMGVDFAFTIGGSSAPLGATYGAAGPDAFAVTFLSPPVLEGDPAGVLTLSFAEPIAEIAFSLALPVIGDIAPAAHIELFEGATSIAMPSLSTATQSGGIWSEAEFAWSDPNALVTVAALSLDQANVIDDPFINAFWLDDLFYSTADASVPEPGTFLLVGAGLAAVGWARRRRASAPRGSLGS